MSRSLLLLLLAGILLQAAAYANVPIRFEHLTVNDGLPENSVRSILQDRHGFLWFGTHNGVARFDGTRMLVHLPDPDDPHSIGIRFVLAMAEDDTGAIWLGSYSAGLSRFDPVNETFTNFAAEGDSLPGPGIAAVVAAADGVWISDGAGRLFQARGDTFTRIDVPPFDDGSASSLAGIHVSPRELWVGSTSGGLARQDRITGTWQHFRADPDDPESLPSNYVTFVHRDRDGRIWVGGRAGLALYKGNGRFAVFRPRLEQGETDLNYLICATEDNRGGFWIGAAVGLYRFDPLTGAFTLHVHDPDRPDSPVRGPVLSTLCDRSGIIWAGSWHTGLNKYDPGSAKFEVYGHQPGLAGSLDDNAIGAVYEDRGGDLWVGTGSRSAGSTVGGLNYRESGETEFRHIPFPEQGETRVRTVNAIAEDRDGMLWVGTNLGVWQVSPDRKTVVRPEALETAPAALFTAMTLDFVSDTAGRMWVATWMGGLHRYDPLTGEWTTYRADPDDPQSLAADDLITICNDGAGRLWVGTDGGSLQVYDPESDGFRTALDASYESEGICQIIAGEDGRVIIGTGAGIMVCEGRKLLKTYTTRTGLPSDYAARIVLDKQGDLWASTSLGLVRIDAATEEVTVFDRRDGLPRNEIHFGSAGAKDGTLFFGGRHGLVVFHPEQLVLNPYIPPVRITELRISDNPVAVGPDSPLTRSLLVTKEVRLGPEQNDLALTFASLDFAHPERNRYRFRLEPNDQDWRVATGSRTAQYTNLDPGTYIFSVMGSNGDGIWSPEPASLQIVITPPWYRTGWANTLYVLAIIGFAVGVYRALINRERMHMALEMERAEASHLQNLDHLKSRFFANISHEFRTPLTLLMSPLQRLQEDPASGTPELFGTMARNARRLGRLIDQLLDLSRLEADRMPSRWRHGDWCQFMRALTSSFTAIAEQRGIVFESRWPAQSSTAWYDSDLIDKILVNLLSNAFKFTPGGGEITSTVKLAETSGPRPWPGHPDEEMGEAVTMTIIVHNTGSHIPAHDLENVFDRFHQVVENSDYGDLGSGIGLALVKELAEWCGGDVDVSSDIQAGTAFTVTLPLFLSAPPSNVPAAAGDENHVGDGLAKDTELILAEEEMDDLPESALPTVLVVEDNADLRNYVREELADEFQVLVAANGKSGLELARSEIPDLVLSDVMMPEMDGMELCRALKADDLTNHVPVILLTAKAEAGSRREGLETGADDYVAKPFDVTELRIRIRNLIEQRRLLAERYDKLEVARPGRASNPVPTADDRFLAKAREIISANLEDPEFRVEALCREIGMSRTQLHRKLKAVAGRSAGDFLRAERLNKAAEMLGQGEGNVTEVAYAVGYRSLSQFAKAFREQFGMAPSDFEA
jgi:signal transduction histidine kinase/ligand-binding sensor domain-containing protein/DNA-binding response OmpR family regulator